MSYSTSLRLLTSSAFVAASIASSAQTAAQPAPKSAATAHHSATAAKPGVSATACVKQPDISPKVPALPAGLACPKALYTITTEPSAKLSYVSPMESPALRETLGLDSSSFSLAYIDYKIGTGELAAPHKFYSIHYTGYLLDGTKFDSSLDRGEPIVIGYGQHQVIPGWDTGFDGMRVGGKRRLFIPYQLAYGANGHPPAIPAKAELIFDVELVAQNDTRPTPPVKPAPPAAPAKPATPAPEAKPAPAPAAAPAATDAAKPKP